MLLGRGVGGARVAPRCAVRIEAEAIASRRVLLGVGGGAHVAARCAALSEAEAIASRPSSFGTTALLPAQVQASQGLSVLDTQENLIFWLIQILEQQNLELRSAI